MIQSILVITLVSPPSSPPRTVSPMLGAQHRFNAGVISLPQTMASKPGSTLTEARTILRA